MAAVTILADSAKTAVKDSPGSAAVQSKRFYFHIASVANGGAALDQNSIVRMVRLPAEARIIDILGQHEAGGGTNAAKIRRCAVSDGTTHTDILTLSDMSSAGYFRLSEETPAAETCPIPLAVESWIDIEFTGASGWPVDKYIQGEVLYTVPTFDDEFSSKYTDHLGV
jgi:hypothetical protein